MQRAKKLVGPMKPTDCVLFIDPIELEAQKERRAALRMAESKSCWPGPLSYALHVVSLAFALQFIYLDYLLLACDSSNISGFLGFPYTVHLF